MWGRLHVPAVTPAAAGPKQIAVDTCNAFGHTPLHIATIKGDLQAVAFLLVAGANVDAKVQIVGG